MALLTILRVREILCSFRLVLEGKPCKEISESSRLEFFKKVFSKQFCFVRCRKQHPRLLNRGGIVDLPFLRTLLWEHKFSSSYLLDFIYMKNKIWSMHTAVWQIPRQRQTTEHLKLSTNKHFNLFRNNSHWLYNSTES